MGTLSKQEKDALEDVFLSIHIGKNRYEKVKELSPFIIASGISSVVSKLLKRAKFGLKEKKYMSFFSFFDKKKKYLSK
ncbi:hypothetical protein [Sulfurimonas sp.]|jgi:hypothetical protein|uniref:hypothetical protein n=1 Tax=Sulfurimonas sp. TaxID=2022749 RepID=UPI0025FD78ED|nr:hypothetical protein [Sulfurimonas sp.]MCK9472596.1 hypothetical protein [Sulfurimonas sp.]MDD3504931.1 hypothetical protein [Sulfurimonas sp.]